MAPSRPPDDLSAQEEAALHASLCLLDAAGSEGGKGLDWGRGVFRKPNPRALEALLFHCCAVVKGKAAAKKHFKGCWPLLDKDRKQAKDFYQVRRRDRAAATPPRGAAHGGRGRSAPLSQKAQDWLKEAGQLDAHGHSLAPFQRNPSGPKLVSFLCDLTFWALGVQHERMYPDDAPPGRDVGDDAALLAALAEPLVTAARAQNQRQVQRLLAACQAGAQVQAQAEAAAAQLRDMYYALTAQLKDARASADGSLSPEQLFSLLEGSLTPAQGGFGSLPPLPELPGELRGLLAEAQQLWAMLEAHVREFAGLAGLVDALAGTDTHPHAIDGAQLRELGQLPGTPASAGLDIAAMLEAWLTDVAEACRYVRQLAGQDTGAPPPPHATWGSCGGTGASGGGAPSSVTPLVATSDAASHAPHLFAQLGLHTNCLDHMRGMRTALGLQMAAVGALAPPRLAARRRPTPPRAPRGVCRRSRARLLRARGRAAERIKVLEQELFGIMADEERCCLEAVAASGQAPPEPHAPVGGAGGTASLFGDGALQLVPPTPLLQQLVQKHRGARQPEQPPAVQPPPPPFGAAAAPRSRSASPPLPPAAAEGCVDSPRQHARAGGSPAAASPGGSSVSSAAMPACELLMSKEVMDLDLVDLDDDDDDHPGGAAHLGGAGLALGSSSPMRRGGGAAGGGAPRLSLALLQGSLGDGEPAFSLSGLGGAGGCGDTPPQVGAGAGVASQAADEGAAEAADEAAEAGEQGSPAGGAEALADPLAPLSLSGSERLSSARPRRLTFAAAVSADSASLSLAGGGSPPSPGSSEVSSCAGGAPAAADAAAAGAGSQLSLLRQRFASVMNSRASPSPSPGPMASLGELAAPLLGGAGPELPPPSGVKPAVSDCKLQDKCFLADGAATNSDGYNTVQRKLVIACVLCFIFMGIEVAGGYFAKSVAIMSDAAHMLSDVSAFLVSIFATWAATQPSTWHYSFGYHRAEILGALISVLTIWAVTGALVFEAFQRTLNPVRVDGKLMFIISVAGVVFNILIALTLGVHAHLGHSHGPGGGCGGHDHGHGGCGGHGHDHGAVGHSHGPGGGCEGKGHAHDHSEHGHGAGGHAHAKGGCCGHGHGHDHDSDSDDSHGSHGSHGGAEHGHGHGHGHSHGSCGAAPPAPGGSECVVIDLPDGTGCGQAGHADTCRCTIRKTGSREIEVRCELPLSVDPAALAAAAVVAAAAPRASHGGAAHGGGGGGDAGSLNLRSAVLHVIGDLLQSVGVAIAGALIWLHQDDPRWYLADPICTFVFSIVVLLTTKSILRDIVHVLMERTPQHMDLPAVSRVMLGMEGIADVHDLHIWNISTSMKPVLTAHVAMRPGADASAVLAQLEAYVRGLGIDHSTIQICPSRVAAGGDDEGEGA
ncbi:zinc transporter [Scenedesmus sp. PABB004]|nr:zinc transporter [Scenedesmus sp. PABB004]